MLNIAIGFALLLGYLASLVSHTLVSNLFFFPVNLCLIVIGLFLLLRFTPVYEYLKPSILVQFIFGISNIMIIGSCTIVYLAFQGEGDPGPGAVLGAVLFIYPGLILLSIGTVILIAQAYHIDNQKRNSDE
jgi:hypothetical protein